MKRCSVFSMLCQACISVHCMYLTKKTQTDIDWFTGWPQLGHKSYKTAGCKKINCISKTVRKDRDKITTAYK